MAKTVALTNTAYDVQMAPGYTPLILDIFWERPRPDNQTVQ